MSAPTFVPQPTLTSDTGFGSWTVITLSITALGRALPAGATVTLDDGTATQPCGLLFAYPVGATSIDVVSRTGLVTHNFLVASPTVLHGVATPVVGPLGFYYRGLIFGENGTGNTYQTVSIQGFDVPAVASGDAQRPIDTGEIAGVDVQGGRDFIVQMIVAATNAADLGAARRALGAVMTPDPAGVTEYPFIFAAEDGTTYAVNARPRKHNFKVDLNPVQAFGLIATLQLHATDPRIYSSPTYRLVLSVTAGAAAGTAANNGGQEMRPIVTVTATADGTGPVVIREQDVPGTPATIYDPVMANGDQLIIDEDFHTAWYVPNVGGPYDALAGIDFNNSYWWNIPAGDAGPDNIQFSVIAGSAVLWLDYADAWASV